MSLRPRRLSLSMGAKRHTGLSVACGAILFLSSVVIVPAPAQVRATTDSDTAYAPLLDRLIHFDTLMDFRALRFGYAHSAAYDPSSSVDAVLHRQLHNALGKGDLKTVRVLADSFHPTPKGFRTLCSKPWRAGAR